MMISDTRKGGAVNKIWYVSHYYDHRRNRTITSVSRKGKCRYYTSTNRAYLLMMNRAVDKKVRDGRWNMSPMPSLTGWSAYGNYFDVYGID